MSKLSDSRPGHFIVEDAVFNFNLTPFEGWIYMAILKHANRQTGVAFPGIATLARLCNMSRAQVIRCIKALEKKGVLEVRRDTKPVEGEKRRRENNRYVVKTLTGSVPQTLQEGEVVSGSEYPSNSQELPLVSDSDKNHSN